MMAETLSSLEDDGGLSSDFVVSEKTAHDVTPQALWVGVRHYWHGNTRSAEPVIQICYQEKHYGSPLAGPVFVDAETWRELNRAVKRQLRKWRREDRRRKWLTGGR